MTKETLELKSLAGQHKLSGVDVISTTINGEDAESVIFVLDGVKYKVTEDPGDGYRSYADRLEIVKDKVSNTFRAVAVLCRYRTKGTYNGEDDVLEVISLKTGQTILEIGTSNIDDYYPSFVCNFSAEAIGVKP